MYCHTETASTPWDNCSWLYACGPADRMQADGRGGQHEEKPGKRILIEEQHPAAAPASTMPPKKMTKRTKFWPITGHDRASMFACETS